MRGGALGIVLSTMATAMACGGGANVKVSADAAGLSDAGAADAVTSRLSADPGQPRYVLVGEDVVLDGSRSVDATRYRWDFGDGRGTPAASSDPVAHVIYSAAGRYRAVLTVFDAEGHRRTAGVVISATLPVVSQAVPSAPLALIPGTRRVAVVVPDADVVIVLERNDTDRFQVVLRHMTERGPRTLAVWNGWIAVACPDNDRVDLIPVDGQRSRQLITLPYGSRPFGVAGGGDTLYVSLQTAGALAQLTVDSTGTARLAHMADVVPDARGVSALPDGRVAVTRWRSPGTQGEVAVYDPVSDAVTVTPLLYDDRVPSDGRSGGVPSYLEQVVVSPDGRSAIVPSLIANFGDGGFRNGRALTFETTLRGLASFVVLPAATERLTSRVQFDDRGFAAAAAFSPRGDYGFFAMRGNRTVERLDLLDSSAAGTLIDTGHAPDGLVVTSDGRFLLVNASLERELTVYDLDRVEQQATPVDRIPLLDVEPLPDPVLRGKRLFNDSMDPRLARSGYIACAHCHLDGDSDHRTWDFSDRGEGLRNTISLLGRAGGDGPLHWSANFDEVQDFEHDIRAAFGGTGLLPDATFHADGHDQSLGASKAGLSDDLDALAAYVASLETWPRSPWRLPDGSLTAAGARGRALFESNDSGCTTCHSGPHLTDSAFAPGGRQPNLHDVGTLGPGSGKRLGGALPGIDTPTLFGLWMSQPYLHDGSAPDLRAVLRDRNSGDRHGKTTQLSETQLGDLVEYLLSLDGRTD